MSRAPGIAPRTTVNYARFDETAVRVLLTGCSHVPIIHDHKHTPEVVEAVRRCAARGLTDRETMHVIPQFRTVHAVCKLRERHKIPAGRPVNRRSADPETLARSSGALRRPA